MKVEQVEALLMNHDAVENVIVEVKTPQDGSAASLVATIVPLAKACSLQPGASGEKQCMQGGYRRLPNGLQIVQQSTFETNILYPEIFEAEMYLRHGVTLAEGDCVFDVGANIGLFTLFAHQKCRKDVQIYAFEPSPHIFEILQTNATLHEINVQLFDCGLSSESKQAPLVFFPHMSGMSGLFSSADKDKRIFKRGIYNWLQDGECAREIATLSRDLEPVLEKLFSESKELLCHFRPLSDVIHEHHIERIDLLKIDVERSELDVLCGIYEADWPKIKQIVAEVHSPDLLERITALLEGKGYNIVVEMEESVVLEQDFERNDKYRLYMVYAVQVPPESRRRGICPRTTTITVERPLLSANEVRDFFREGLPNYKLLSDLRHYVLHGPHSSGDSELPFPLEFVFVDQLPSPAAEPQPGPIGVL